MSFYHQPTHKRVQGILAQKKCLFHISQNKKQKSDVPSIPKALISPWLWKCRNFSKSIGFSQVPFVLWRNSSHYQTPSTEFHKHSSKHMLKQSSPNSQRSSHSCLFRVWCMYQFKTSNKKKSILCLQVGYNFLMSHMQKLVSFRSMLFIYVDWCLRLLVMFTNYWVLFAFPLNAIY